MKFKIKIGEKEFNIELSENREGVKIKVGEKEFLFEDQKEKIPQLSFPKKDFSKKEILAPISGQILEIFVKEGDWIKKGQSLLILSAMKMENEILAEKEGKVKKIFVKKGENVKKDAKLIEIQ